MNNPELSNKLFRYFTTKSRFDSTTKALDETNECYVNSEGDIIYDTPEIKWQDICFIENWAITSYISVKKMYTHGQFYACGLDDTITLSYAYTNNVHGLADALDVIQTINRIGENTTVENVISILNMPEDEATENDNNSEEEQE